MLLSKYLTNNLKIKKKISIFIPVLFGFRNNKILKTFSNENMFYKIFYLIFNHISIIEVFFKNKKIFYNFSKYFQTNLYIYLLKTNSVILNLFFYFFYILFMTFENFEDIYYNKLLLKGYKLRQRYKTFNELIIKQDYDSKFYFYNRLNSISLYVLNFNIYKNNYLSNFNYFLTNVLLIYKLFYYFKQLQYKFQSYNIYYRYHFRIEKKMRLYFAKSNSMIYKTLNTKLVKLFSYYKLFLEKKQKSYKIIKKKLVTKSVNNFFSISNKNIYEKKLIKKYKINLLDKLIKKLNSTSNKNLFTFKISIELKKLLMCLEVNNNTFDTLYIFIYKLHWLKYNSYYLYKQIFNYIYKFYWEKKLYLKLNFKSKELLRIIKSLFMNDFDKLIYQFIYEFFNLKILTQNLFYQQMLYKYIYKTFKINRFFDGFMYKRSSLNNLHGFYSTIKRVFYTFNDKDFYIDDKFIDIDIITFMLFKEYRLLFRLWNFSNKKFEMRILTDLDKDFLEIDYKNQKKKFYSFVLRYREKLNNRYKLKKPKPLFNPNPDLIDNFSIIKYYVNSFKYNNNNMNLQLIELAKKTYVKKKRKYLLRLISKRMILAQQFLSEKKKKLKKRRKLKKKKSLINLIKFFKIKKLNKSFVKKKIKMFYLKKNSTIKDKIFLKKINMFLRNMSFLRKTIQINKNLKFVKNLNKYKYLFNHYNKILKLLNNQVLYLKTNNFNNDNKIISNLFNQIKRVKLKIKRVKFIFLKRQLDLKKCLLNMIHRKRKKKRPTYHFFRYYNTRHPRQYKNKYRYNKYKYNYKTKNKKKKYPTLDRFKKVRSLKYKRLDKFVTYIIMKQFKRRSIIFRKPKKNKFHYKKFKLKKQLKKVKKLKNKLKEKRKKKLKKKLKKRKKKKLKKKTKEIVRNDIKKKKSVFQFTLSDFKFLFQRKAINSFVRRKNNKRFNKKGCKFLKRIKYYLFSKKHRKYTRQLNLLKVLSLKKVNTQFKLKNKFFNNDRVKNYLFNSKLFSKLLNRKRFYYNFFLYRLPKLKLFRKSKSRYFQNKFFKRLNKFRRRNIRIIRRRKKKLILKKKHILKTKKKIFIKKKIFNYILKPRFRHLKLLKFNLNKLRKVNLFYIRNKIKKKNKKKILLKKLYLKKLNLFLKKYEKEKKKYFYQLKLLKLFKKLINKYKIVKISNNLKKKYLNKKIINIKKKLKKINLRKKKKKLFILKNNLKILQNKLINLKFKKVLKFRSQFKILKINKKIKFYKNNQIKKIKKLNKIILKSKKNMFKKKPILIYKKNRYFFKKQNFILNKKKFKRVPALYSKNFKRTLMYKKFKSFFLLKKVRVKLNIKKFYERYLQAKKRFLDYRRLKTNQAYQKFSNYRIRFFLKHRGFKLFKKYNKFILIKKTKKLYLNKIKKHIKQLKFLKLLKNLKKKIYKKKIKNLTKKQLKNIKKFKILKKKLKEKLQLKKKKRELKKIKIKRKKKKLRKLKRRIQRKIRLEEKRLRILHYKIPYVNVYRFGKLSVWRWKRIDYTKSENYYKQLHARIKKDKKERPWKYKKKRRLTKFRRRVLFRVEKITNELKKMIKKNKLENFLFFEKFIFFFKILLKTRLKLLKNKTLFKSLFLIKLKKYIKVILFDNKIRYYNLVRIPFNSENLYNEYRLWHTYYIVDKKIPFKLIRLYAKFYFNKIFYNLKLKSEFFKFYNFYLQTRIKIRYDHLNIKFLQFKFLPLKKIRKLIRIGLHKMFRRSKKYFISSKNVLFSLMRNGMVYMYYKLYLLSRHYQNNKTNAPSFILKNLARRRSFYVSKQTYYSNFFFIYWATKYYGYKVYFRNFKNGCDQFHLLTHYFKFMKQKSFFFNYLLNFIFLYIQKININILKYVFIINQYKTKLIIPLNKFYKYLLLFFYKRNHYLSIYNKKKIDTNFFPIYFSFFSIYFKQLSVELINWYNLVNNSEQFMNYYSTFLFKSCFILHNTIAIYLHYKYKYLYYYRVYNFYVFYIFYYLYNHLYKVYKTLKLKSFKLAYDLIKNNEYNRYYLGLRTRMLILTIRNRYKKGFTIERIFRNLKFFLRESMRKKELAGYYISIRGRYKRSSRSNKLIIKKGTYSFNKIDLKVDSSYGTLNTRYGIAGIKVIFAFK